MLKNKGFIMKKLTFIGIAFFLLAFCSACSSIRVSADFNPAYDFTKLRTYAWLDDKAPSSDVRINNDLIIERVRSAVERNLEAKGYVKSTSGASVDFEVSWFGVINRKLQVSTIDHFYGPYGYGALGADPFRTGASVGMRTTTASEYEEGTLIVDILDPREHKLIWRGSGTERLEEKENPAAATQGINDAMDAILAGFPPVQ